MWSAHVHWPTSYCGVNAWTQEASGTLKWAFCSVCYLTQCYLGQVSSVNRFLRELEAGEGNDADIEDVEEGEKKKGGELSASQTGKGSRTYFLSACLCRHESLKNYLRSHLMSGS